MAKCKKCGIMGDYKDACFICWLNLFIKEGDLCDPERMRKHKRNYALAQYPGDYHQSNSDIRDSDLKEELKEDNQEGYSKVDRI